MNTAATARAGIPAISIGMPVYNGGDLFPRALASILGQSVQDIEVVVSDNGSTDDTPGHARAAAARDPRVRYYRQETTVSALHNFLFTLKHARAEIFFWAPHDDRWDPAFARLALAALQARPDAAMAMGTARYLDPEGALLWFDAPPYGLDHPLAYDRIRAYLRNGTTDMLFYGVFRRRILDGVDWIDSTCPEKSVIMAILAAGPVIDVDGMEYLNRLSKKSKQDVATIFGLPSYSLRYQWRALLGILAALRRGVSTWDFLRLAPQVVVRQNWHRQLLRECLVALKLMKP